ncbi:hypothetical protein ACXO8F_07800, partial [Lactobacillus delbrueckii subsp. bulgaricus]
SKPLASINWSCSLKIQNRPSSTIWLYANFPGFYNSSHTADRFSASRISFMHDFPEMRESQL